MFSKTVILTFFCVINIFAMEDFDKDFNVYFENLKYSLDKVDNQVIERANVSLIVGNSGSGKSTLFNFIAGRQLVSERVGSRFIFSVKDPVLGSEVSHGLNSGTSAPVFFESYCDTAGFKDTRGVVQDILNCYFIHQLVKKTENVRLIVPISQGMLDEDRKKSLLNLFTDLGKIIGDGNYSRIGKGICFVFTKNKGRTHDDIVKEFYNDTQDLQPLLNVAGKSFFKFISSPDSIENIIFFNNPKEDKQIPEIITVKGQLNKGEDLREYLENIGYFQNLDPRLVISDSGRSLVKEIVMYSKDETKKLLSVLLENSVEYYGKRLIESYVGMANDLRISIEDLSFDLSFQSDLYKEDMSKLLKMFKLFFSRELAKNFEKHLERLEFFSKLNLGIDENLTIDLLPYQNLFNVFKKECGLFKDLGHYKEVMLDENVCRIKSLIIGNSDIKKLMTRNPNLKNVIVGDFERFIFDENLHNIGAQWNKEKGFVFTRNLNLAGNNKFAFCLSENVGIRGSDVQKMLSLRNCLSVLDLSNNYIDIKGIQALGNGIPNLEVLTLQRCGLKSNSIVELFKGNFSKLKILDLSNHSYNPSTAEGLKYLGKKIATSSIHDGENKIWSGVKGGVSGLVSGTFGGVVDGVHTVLKAYSSDVYKSYEENGLWQATKEGMVAPLKTVVGLAEIVKSPIDGIKGATEGVKGAMGYPNQIVLEGFQALSKVNWSLVELYLNGVNINSDVVKEIAKGLWKNTLEVLSLDWNLIDCDGLKSLISDNWSKLKTVRLSSNRIKNNGFRSLFNQNNRNHWSKLQNIDLGNNSIDFSSTPNSEQVRAQWLDLKAYCFCDLALHGVLELTDYEKGFYYASSII